MTVRQGRDTRDREDSLRNKMEKGAGLDQDKVTCRTVVQTTKEVRALNRFLFFPFYPFFCLKENCKSLEARGSSWQVGGEGGRDKEG